jgi:hypothetical protein
LLPTGFFKSGQTRRADVVPSHPWAKFEPSNHDFARRCGGADHCGKGCRNPLCSDDSAADDAVPGSIFGGRTMNGDRDRPTEKNGADVKDSRRDRLKLALRENLKRRKSQARGRSDASASSESADASLDTASREKP